MHDPKFPWEDRKPPVEAPRHDFTPRSKAEKGYAALITIDFEKQDVMWTIFEEEEGDRPDPLLSAQALGRSIASDWPNHEQKVIGNDRAGELQADRILGGSRWRLKE